MQKKSDIAWCWCKKKKLQGHKNLLAILMDSKVICGSNKKIKTYLALKFLEKKISSHWSDNNCKGYFILCKFQNEQRKDFVKKVTKKERIWKVAEICYCG